MKKIYIAFITTITTGSTIPMTLNQINQIMVNRHNGAFGVDHLFDQQINNEKLESWQQVGLEVKKYVLDNAKDLFGSQDPILFNALNRIEKANKVLISAIKMTYALPRNTKNLRTMAAFFQSIENKMKTEAESLKKSTFILRNKKNAQSLLLTFALFIETTAQKANKDTRMGHRTDIVIPQTPPASIPPRKTLPTLSSTPTTYEEEPAFSPPTRTPAPPVKTSSITPSYYEEEPAFSPPTRRPEIPYNN